jgi:hypothetical protein
MASVKQKCIALQSIKKYHPLLLENNFPCGYFIVSHKRYASTVWYIFRVGRASIPLQLVHKKSEDDNMYETSKKYFEPVLILYSLGGNNTIFFYVS